MQRQIYEVNKKILGSAVGGYVPTPSGFPKIFDSHAVTYNDDINAALLAATGAFAAAWSEICTTTTNRDMQVVMLMTADGFVIDKKVVGAIPEVPAPEEDR